MEWLGPALSLFGGLFGGGARQQQQQDQYAQELEKTQNQILQAMFGRAQNTYWPLEDVGLTGVKQRAQSTPVYANEALRVASRFAQPMNLSY